ncbi:hypothetical protein PTSG_13212 [Salpingoeca rosetta]|uniref:Uncharacterized protein n=1 Tax=Salpingoeca rosetta (strain ATCC 50818 / BSB-021) TaxID=946362 RepID=F2UTJ0_SALR5|nr:uncharacterized protein PTSG_13212 [Salpingoeca rosetta]EGD83712.1 hypothetical protein PTSG_13212 [Salpingoeca rosetta]|eukprot:XP_004987515.1 hypothetical protein PTSG_13212 [Salpingoeca rosetta]
MDAAVAQKGLVEAVITDNVFTAFTCLASGARANHQIVLVSGHTASLLHIAAACGQLELCELLLFHGANPTLEDSSGRTPAEAARATGCLDCAVSISLHTMAPLRRLCTFIARSGGADVWSGDANATPGAGRIAAATNKALSELLSDIHDDVERRELEELWSESTKHRPHIQQQALPLPFLPVSTIFPPLRQQINRLEGTVNDLQATVATLRDLVVALLEKRQPTQPKHHEHHEHHEQQQQEGEDLGAEEEVVPAMRQQQEQGVEPGSRVEDAGSTATHAVTVAHEEEEEEEEVMLSPPSSQNSQSNLGFMDDDDEMV